MRLLLNRDLAVYGRLVTTSHASSHGFNDPSHPVEGREAGIKDVKRAIPSAMLMDLPPAT